MAVNLNVEAIRQQIAEGIDIMVHLERTSEGKRRVCEICEIEDYRDGRFILNSLLRLNEKGQPELTGNKLKKTDRIYLKGEKYADGLRKYGLI